jgi:uncharacterized protein (DUF1800 family)
MRLIVCCLSGLSLTCAHVPTAIAMPSVVNVPANIPPLTRVATHLLNRLAFGPTEVDRALVNSLGLAGYIEDQLIPRVDPNIETALAPLTTQHLSVAEAYAQFPNEKDRLKNSGVDVKAIAPETLKMMEKELRDEFRDAQPKQILLETTQAKILRAVQSTRQLEEVLVDFWFNHFNVSAEKSTVKWTVGAYERDAIRPFVFGHFEDLLRATAKHPAMLVYLDNFQSVRDDGPARRNPNAPKKGLNENYARELMELHTLGVNAGYSQDDVREAARALTGWTIAGKNEADEFGEFQFKAKAHDDGAKHIFGLDLDARGGQQDGELLISFLAHHPATAAHVCRKLLRRFVTDEPSEVLVSQIAAVFLKSNGNLTQVYRAIFSTPEFWAASNMGTKTKTPFEFVVSAVRAAGNLQKSDALVKSMEALGQPLYRCSAPTGFAEVAGPWTSAGALVTRINFGLSLATGRVKGVASNPPQASGTRSDIIDEAAASILGASPSPATRRVIAAQLGAGEAVNEQRPIDMSLVVGLLIGSPEFQKQ